MRSFCRDGRAYRDKLATALQSAFRAYKARCRFQGVKNAWIAKRIAATEIQSGWRFVGKQTCVRKAFEAKGRGSVGAYCYEEESDIIREDLDDVMYEDKVQRHVKSVQRNF